MKAIFHLDLDDKKILNIGLTNMENLRRSKARARIHLVVNGPAVQLFRKDQDTDLASRITALTEDGILIFCCENALAKFDMTAADLVPGCLTVPAGVVALIEHQQQGFAYIKP